VTGVSPRTGRAPTFRRLAPLIGTHGILLVMSAVSLMPFVAILFVSFYPPGQAATGFAVPERWHVANYPRAWETADFSRLIASSAIVAIAVVAIGTVVCILSGYAFATMRFAGRGMLYGLFLLGLLLPFEAVIVALYYDLRAVGLVDTHAGLILPEAALFLSFGTMWMRAHFASVPRSLVEAARIDGANSWTTLWRVLVPNAGPPVTTMMVLFFIWSWNEFLLALVLAQDPSVRTAPAGVGIFVGERTTDLTGLAAAAIILTVPALVVYAFLQRSFIRGVTSGGVKG
jgi:raffinose/stachyose/melibiose transport system permease protein